MLYRRIGLFFRWLRRFLKGGICLLLLLIVKMRFISFWFWIFCMERYKVCFVYKIECSGYLKLNKRLYMCVIYIFCLYIMKLNLKWVCRIYVYWFIWYGLFRNFFNDLGYVCVIKSLKIIFIFIICVIFKNGV